MDNQRVLHCVKTTEEVKKKKTQVQLNQPHSLVNNVHSQKTTPYLTQKPQTKNHLQSLNRPIEQQ